MTGVEMWQELRAIMEAKLSEAAQLLAEAYENADRTFEDRLSKVRSDTLVGQLNRARAESKSNYAASVGLMGFCQQKFEEHEELLLENVGSVEVSSGSGADLPFEEAMAKLTELAEMDMAASIMVTTARFTFDTLVLCALLAGLLGHKEAVAFEEGAKKELLGALGDPGPGIVTLLKRLYAVSTRTLRADQSADELLESLDSFVNSMDQWRQVLRLMSKDVAVDRAIEEVFVDVKE